MPLHFCRDDHDHRPDAPASTSMPKTWTPRRRFCESACRRAGFGDRQDCPWGRSLPARMDSGKRLRLEMGEKDDNNQPVGYVVVMG